MTTLSSGMDPVAFTAAPVDAGRKWRVLVAVAMGVLLSTIDGSILNIALPTLVRELDTSFAVIQWTVLGYLLTLATLSVLIGRLGDLVGKKRIFTIGFSLFTLASGAAGLSPAVGWLIGFRMLQGVGAAMLLSLGIAILTEAFPPQERGKALGWIGTTVSLGIVTGPVVGGLLLDALSWRWIFFVNIPLGIMGTVTAWRFVPASPPLGRQRFDLAGAGALSLVLLALSLALTLGQGDGFASPPILALFATAALAAAAFVRIELSVQRPMVELRLFRTPGLAVGIVTGFLSFTAIGVIFLMPFYLEGVLGFDPATAGRLMAGPSLIIGVVAPLSGSLSDRIGVRPITLVGMVILVLGYLGALRLGAGTSVAGFLLALVPVGLGMGIFQSPNNSQVLGSVTRQHFGLAGGLLSLSRILGQMTGFAVLGSLWATRAVARAGDGFTGDAAAAPPAALVGALHDIIWVAVGLSALGTLIVAIGILRQHSAARAGALLARERRPHGR